jgi:hypothetical protein
VGCDSRGGKDTLPRARFDKQWEDTLTAEGAGVRSRVVAALLGSM